MTVNFLGASLDFKNALELVPRSTTSRLQLSCIIHFPITFQSDSERIRYYCMK